MHNDLEQRPPYDEDALGAAIGTKNMLAIYLAVGVIVGAAWWMAELLFG